MFSGALKVFFQSNKVDRMRYWRRANADRLRPIMAERQRAYRSANPEKCNAASRRSKSKYRAENREAYRQQCREYYRRSRDAGELRYYGHQIKKYYGIILAEYERMMAEQDGVCAICKKKPEAMLGGAHKMLCVDHCHVTGAVRGLLCSSCNKLLGDASDQIVILEAAISYLKKSGSNE